MIASLPTLKCLVLFSILLALILIVVWVASCSGFEIFFFVTTIKLSVVVLFMKYVVFVWPVYIWFLKISTEATQHVKRLLLLVDSFSVLSRFIHA